MATNTLPTRAEVAEEYKWDLESIYPQDSQWEDAFSQVGPLVDEIKTYNGRLGESGDTLFEAFKLRDTVSHKLERLYTYARMRRDEDNTDARYQAFEDRARVLYARVSEGLSFFDPELLEVGEERIKEFVAGTEGLKLYEHQLDDLF